MNTTIKSALELIERSSQEAKQCEQELKALLKKHRQTLKRSRRGVNNILNAIENMRALQKRYISEADYYLELNQYLRD